jgi:hypothetical protein
MSPKRPTEGADEVIVKSLIVNLLPNNMPVNGLDNDPIGVKANPEALILPPST